MGGYVKHVIKYDYQDGVKLSSPVLWCGIKSTPYEWYFQDAQHVALSILHETRLVPCKNCRKALVKILTEGE